jgi:hypothetical protein
MAPQFKEKTRLENSSRSRAERLADLSEWSPPRINSEEYMNLAILLWTAVSLVPCGDECKKVKNPKPITPWTTVVIAESKTVKSLHGRIVDASENPVAGVIIEVISIPKEGKAKIVYVCQTAKSGSFRFASLPDGNYEVRAKLEGYDQTIVRVAISKFASSSELVSIPMKASN